MDAALRERVVGEIYLGDETFIRRLMPDEPIAEIPRVQWQPLRPHLDELATEADGIVTAYRTYGYRLREIAQHYGVHPATVSRALARLEQADTRQLPQTAAEELVCANARPDPGSTDLAAARRRAGGVRRVREQHRRDRPEADGA